MSWARSRWQREVLGPLTSANRELLRFLQPHVPERAALLSERVAPALREVGRTQSGRPAQEVFAALEAVVLGAGASPDRAALAEFAARIEAGDNPFA